MEQLEELKERVAADGQYIALTVEIDDCMRIGEFTFVGYDEMEREVERRLIDAGLASDGVSEPAELELDVLEGRLRNVQAFELQLAAEFHRCTGGFDGWCDRVDEIAETYRAEFLGSSANSLGL